MSAFASSAHESRAQCCMCPCDSRDGISVAILDLSAQNRLLVDDPWRDATNRGGPMLLARRLYSRRGVRTLPARKEREAVPLTRQANSWHDSSFDLQLQPGEREPPTSSCALRACNDFVLPGYVPRVPPAGQAVILRITDASAERQSRLAALPHGPERRSDRRR